MKAAALRNRFAAPSGRLKRYLQAHFFGVWTRVIFAARLPVPLVEPAGNIMFRFGSAADLDRIPERMDYSDKAREFGRMRLREGDRLALAESDGRIVFYACLMTGPLDLSGGRLIPTSPAPACYAWASRMLMQQGYTEILCHIMKGNAASIAAHKRAGFTALGSFRQVRLGRRMMFFVPQALRAHLQSRGA